MFFNKGFFFSLKSTSYSDFHSGLSAIFKVANFFRRSRDRQLEKLRSPLVGRPRTVIAPEIPLSQQRTCREAPERL